MKIIMLYIVYVILMVVFVAQVELTVKELLILFATVLVAFFCGKAIGESDKKEDKNESK